MVEKEDDATGRSDRIDNIKAVDLGQVLFQEVDVNQTQIGATFENSDNLSGFKITWQTHIFRPITPGL